MAALESRDPDEALLKTMDETMYLSKNPELKEIAHTMDTVTPNAELLGLIQANNWPAVDGYFTSMPGIDNFLSNLQQLLFFKYRIRGSITRKQFQIAMGIQQMRWMNDPANCLNKDLERSRGKLTQVELIMWEAIPEEEKHRILRQIEESLTDRFRDSDEEILLDKLLAGTVWYIVVGIKAYMWKGYGEYLEYYPIPETLNFTKIANIYVPELVFGILGDISLTEHIATRSARPYIANLPSRGTCQVHNHDFYLCNIWSHEFSHSCVNDGRNLKYNATLDELLPYKNWLKEHREYDDRTKPPSYLISSETPNEDKIALRVLNASRYMNDAGKIWEDVKEVEGGKKRASRRARSRIRRPIAASRTARRVASRLSVRNTRSKTLSARR